MFTNGMLIDNDWLELFCKHDVSVGVSLDGFAEDNDANRIDHKGRGTYQRVVKGWDRLQEFKNSAQYKQTPGLLTVINHKSNYSQILRHFFNDLKAEQVAVLLPDMSHDSVFDPGITAKHYGQKLIEIFDETVKHEKVNERFTSTVLDFFQMQYPSSAALARAVEIENLEKAGGRYLQNQIIVIQSDGEVALDDSFIPALKWRMSQATYNVKTSSLYEYLQLPIFKEIADAYSQLPDQCTSCTWMRACRGGDLENRYKSGNGFNQPSIFCEGLQDYYEHVVGYLYQNGYPQDELEKILLG